jgi:hypothetical protein
MADTKWLCASDTTVKEVVLHYMHIKFLGLSYQKRKGLAARHGPTTR